LTQPLKESKSKGRIGIRIVQIKTMPNPTHTLTFKQQTGLAAILDS